MFNFRYDNLNPRGVADELYIFLSLVNLLVLIIYILVFRQLQSSFENDYVSPAAGGTVKRTDFFV